VRSDRMSAQPHKNTALVRDASVVIRSSGERTTDLCYELACAQVPPENVIVIKEYPFRRAAERSYELGIEIAERWTLCLDADILLRNNAVQTLRNLALTTDDNVLYVQGSIFDKLFGRPRKAGPYFHRTSLLPKLLEYMRAEGESLRPDTDAAMRLAAHGYGRVQQGLIIALHEFEQYYRDIYRKAFVHAHKHADQLPRLEPFWERMAPVDPDYRVALLGLRDGRAFQGTVAHDVRRFPRDLGSVLNTEGLREKEALASLETARWDVDSLLLYFRRLTSLADSKRS
ncbi:MAG: hypothetical protein ACREQK_11750, partial [Candidatus Binatia bacterium]